jgi:hypothetical protein
MTESQSLIRCADFTAVASERICFSRGHFIASKVSGGDSLQQIGIAAVSGIIRTVDGLAVLPSFLIGHYGMSVASLSCFKQ